MVALAISPRSERAEQCCRTSCEYAPDRVRVLVSVIRRLRAAGEDPTEAAASVFASKDGGRGQFGHGSPHARFAAVVADIEGAMRELGPFASPEAIAARLCPWSLDAS